MDRQNQLLVAHVSAAAEELGKLAEALEKPYHPYEVKERLRRVSAHLRAAEEMMWNG